jgi:archaetidylinositol phosphate synthase
VAANTWSHRLARFLVAPLRDTGVTPNHLTTLRLATGLGAAAALTQGEARWDVWAGFLWVLSTLLDYADGELARMTGKTSAFGHVYDYTTDVLVNALFFVSVGIGLQGSLLGWWAVPMGTLAGASIVASSMLAEAIEKRDAAGAKLVPSAGGFDLEHIMYLFALAAWFGLLLPLLVGAAVGAPLAALSLAWLWCRRQPAAAR